ncbi:MAG: hypothetical protein KME46_30410 [Brasilonema angustatum HA4187-MV1]|jgi:hypothetical protein|nr:hypothetical protein [Brasilonema angustatum HA4187-MV1]
MLGIFQSFKKFFTKEELHPKYEQAKKALERIFPDIINLDLDGFLQILFGIGFIGAKVYGQEIYNDYSQNLPRIVLVNINNLEGLVIHPAFHLGLGLRKVKIKNNDEIEVLQKSEDFQSNIQIGGNVSGNIHIQGERI